MNVVAISSIYYLMLNRADMFTSFRIANLKYKQKS